MHLNYKTDIDYDATLNTFVSKQLLRMSSFNILDIINHVCLMFLMSTHIIYHDTTLQILNSSGNETLMYTMVITHI